MDIFVQQMMFASFMAVAVWPMYAVFFQRVGSRPFAGMDSRQRVARAWVRMGKGMPDAVCASLLCAALLLWLGTDSAMAQVVFVDDFGTSMTRTTSPFVPTGGADNALGNFTHGSSFYRFADLSFHETYIDQGGARTGPGNTPGPPNMNPCLASDPYFTNDACYWRSQMIENGYYAVIRPANIYDGTAGIPDWAVWWQSLPDHTGNDGAVLVVNAGTVQNQFYRRLENLEPGAIYRLTAARSALSGGTMMRFEVQHPSTETVLGNSPDLFHSDIAWNVATWQFTVPAACTWPGQYAIALRNRLPANSGNDLYVDDITLEKIGMDTTGGGIACPVLAEAGLVITKSNNVETVVPGGTSIYMLVVTNNGPAAANGAPVRDPVTTGLDCTTAACGTEVNGATCPGATGSALVSALQSGAGAVIGALPANSAVTFTLTCTVTATGLP